MQFELTRDYLTHLISVIDKKNDKEAAKLMDEIHAVDIAEVYNQLNIEQAKYLFLLIEDREKAADVVAELDDDVLVKKLRVEIRNHTD